MKKTLIIVIILLLVFLSVKIIAEKEIDYYSYTKAICNETNFCQDYIITCEDNKIVNSNPITGAAIQLSENWKDPRSEEIIEKLC